MLLSSSSYGYDKCILCKNSMSNNVYVQSNRSCYLYCPLKTKNVGNICFACSQSLCQDGVMPKLQITNTDRYFQAYTVQNTTTFFQQNIDWWKQSSVSISSLQNGTDYTYNTSKTNSRLTFISETPDSTFS